MATKDKADAVTYIRTFGCGAMWWYVLATGKAYWYGGCGHPWTKRAVAYRQSLAWRKRMSQHTGVRLGLVPEPSRVSGFRAEWDDLQLGVQYRVDPKTQVASTHRTCLTMGGECTKEQCFDWQYWIAESRRRLLAKGGDG